MNAPSPSECLNAAVQKTLRGSSMPKAQQMKIARIMRENFGAAHDKQVKLLTEVLEKDFDWPWLNEWIERFQSKRRWPKSYGWKLIADGQPGKPALTEYLQSLKKAELMALGKRFGLSITSRMKVALLREMLQSHLNESQIAEELEDFDKQRQQDWQLQWLKNKRDLLVNTISHVAYNMHRFHQVKSLQRSIFEYRIYAEPDIMGGPLEAELCRKWRFDPNDADNIPPFFPGDHSCIATEILRRRR